MRRQGPGEAAGHAGAASGRRREEHGARRGGHGARAREFEELRPLLFAIAYRIIGSVTEAEDTVQETWLRYQTEPARPGPVTAFLSAVVTRVAVDVLRSARPRQERYGGPWFPQPPGTGRCGAPERSAAPDGSPSTAALVLLERLSPLERAVFVLHDGFGFGFDEIAVAVDRAPAACRRLASRARRHLADGGGPGALRADLTGLAWGDAGNGMRSAEESLDRRGVCDPQWG